MNHTETMRHEKKGMSLILIVAVLCIFFLSNLYISEHIRHSCIGDGCPVCAEIQHARGLINQAGAVLVFALWATGIVYVIVRGLPFIYSFIQRETLISKKVRLND